MLVTVRDVVAAQLMLVSLPFLPGSVSPFCSSLLMELPQIKWDQRHFILLKPLNSPVWKKHLCSNVSGQEKGGLLPGGH